MKIGIGKFLPDGLTTASIEKAFRRVTAAVSAGFSREHNDDGTHKAITAEALTIADSTSTAGVITSNLVPSVTATYDIGRQSTEPTLPFYAWRHLKMTGTISWIASAVNAIGEHIPSWNMGFSGSDLTVASSITTQKFIISVESGSKTFTVGGAATIGPSAITPALKADGSLGVTGSLGVAGRVYGATLGLTDGVTAPASIAGYAIIYVDTADGDLKCRFGDGTIKTIVTNP